MTSPFNMQAMQQHHQLCRARHAFHAQAHQHTQKTTRRSAAKAQGKPLESHQEVVQGSCYEQVIEALAHRALAAAQQLNQQQQHQQQHIIGVAGAPGSGKSTCAQQVARRINQLCSSQQHQQHQHQQQNGQQVNSSAGCRGAVVAPMDGFHYYKAELDAMPDPQAAYARRGAPWTFNAAAFVDAIRTIRQQGKAVLPSFDHGVGDPVEGDIVIDAGQHSIVLVEGNYLFLEEDPWCQLRELFDDSWFVDVDLDTAMQRVYERQVAIGVAPETSRVRIASNDRPNGELVNATRHVARVLVPSSIPFASSVDEE